MSCTPRRIQITCALPARLYHADARIGGDHRAIGADGAGADGDEGGEVVLVGIHLGLGVRR